MGTTIRPEVSKRNQYYLSKHRYYELKHFCLQYPEWKQIYIDLETEGYTKSRLDSMLIFDESKHSSPTEKTFKIRSYYLERMQLVESAAYDAAYVYGEDVAKCLLKGVTEGLSYDSLKSKYNIPCCKDTYYHVYRKIFWILSQERL